MRRTEVREACASAMRRRGTGGGPWRPSFPRWAALRVRGGRQALHRALWPASGWTLPKPQRRTPWRGSFERMVGTAPCISRYELVRTEDPRSGSACDTMATGINPAQSPTRRGAPCVSSAVPGTEEPAFRFRVDTLTTDSTSRRLLTIFGYAAHENRRDRYLLERLPRK